MSETLNEKEINVEDENKVIQTDIDSKDGQNKCPKCGATDISTNVKTGKLRCNFCHYEFDPKKVNGFVEDISKLEGQVIASGAKDIIADSKDVMTFKCSSCGAEVVIDTKDALQARCHWCRNILSVNQQIPNGAVPDVVLAFKTTKQEAQTKINEFVKNRNFYANTKFKKEFTTDNIMGVYFPYVLVDINGHANLVGEAEIETRSYTVSVGNDRRERRYDADRYHVERDFDIAISGLSLESNKDRLDTNSKDKTNNIINSIMPFDIENCVKYDANYLRGYTSERRDTNIDDLRVIVATQSKDIARFAANDSMKKYDRGANWSKEDLKIKGQQWKTAYLPVWLYSYQQVKSDGKKVLHYVAVNARTKETMGSVPINIPKLLIVSIIVEIIAIFIAFDLLEDFDYNIIFLAAGPLYYWLIKSRYRNQNARHTYELETKRDVTNLKSVDKFLKSEKGLRNSMIEGCNNTSVKGSNTGDSLSKISKSTVASALGVDEDVVGFVENLKDINKKEKKGDDNK